MTNGAYWSQRRAARPSRLGSYAVAVLAVSKFRGKLAIDVKKFPDDFFKHEGEL